MCFEKKHDLANEYFHQIDENLGFTHNVSTKFLAYYVSFKSGNKKLDGNLEVKKLNKVFQDFDLVGEGWGRFMYKIEEAPSWSKFDYGFIVYSERAYC